ncbi:hypothetical protein ElyMa_006011900 [Elysia marginata]|uniref:Uncharacterized protein n=1 Tax=Elysia marginata TaxID=1093978 RepID=A0AAV4GHM9_9GAST|nr:hypothetical protein ElyMa_006011900 [Elysia marginata]
MTLKLVVAADRSSVWHYGFSVRSGRPGVRIMFRKTGETLIFLTNLEARWRLFGHILREAINTPPNVAMTKYFKTEGIKQRGRPKTSIVTTLRGDPKSHNSDHWPTRLHSIKDLDNLRNSTEQIRLEAPDDINIQISPGRDIS